MSLILHAVERLGIDLDSEESEYDAYVFYQVKSEDGLNNAMNDNHIILNTKSLRRNPILNLQNT